MYSKINIIVVSSDAAIHELFAGIGQYFFIAIKFVPIAFRYLDVSMYILRMVCVYVCVCEMCMSLVVS